MIEIIVAVVLEVVKCLVPSTRSEISYLRKYKTNSENLKAEVGKLKGISTSIQHKVDEAERNGEEIEDNVQRWLERANEIINEEAVNFTEDQETAANKQCFKGLCPDLKKRYQLSKGALRQLEAVVRHREAGNFDSISYCPSPKDPRLSNKNYVAFESRQSTLNDILSAITDRNFNIIGICGMGGVGKTTLAKEVAKLAERNKLFDRVVFAGVSQSPQIEKIQGEIADRLGLSLSNVETRSGRAGKLCERLKKEKNILVILDDIWTSLDLEAVGVPLGVDHKGCKVLLTARSVDLLSRKMDSQVNFEIRILNDIESWNLFKKIAGNYIEGNEFRSVATKVAKKCSGLPIAIVTVAKALRNKRLFEWEDALQQLWRSSSDSIEGIHATIELSYDHLKREELKKTFLLIGYSYINSIDDLLAYGVGLDLFESINKMEDVQARVRTLVQNLKDSCMLLDSSIFGEDFSMHDVVRDVAISIASRKHQVFTMRSVPNDQWKWPDESMLKCYSSVVLDNIQSGYELQEVLDWPQLKFFRAQNWSKSSILTDLDSHSLKFSEDFFSKMTELRVLDLSLGNSLSLPSSVGLLTNLQTLHLKSISGNMKGLVVIGDLKKLEILRLSCAFMQLPKEVGQLTQLKLLDLRGCFHLFIPPKIISCLSHLEELYLGDFTQWKMEGLPNKGEYVSLVELNHLSSLTSLQIQIKDANTLPRDLSFFKKLERYKILVGKPQLYEDEKLVGEPRLFEYKHTLADISRIFKFRNPINANICFDVWHIIQLKRIESLILDGWLDKRNFLYGLENEGFSQLKYLQVGNNPNLSCIVECSNNNNGAVIELGQLHLLILHCLPQLTSFCSKLKTQRKISTTDTRSNEIINLEDDMDVPNILFNEKVSLPNLENLELYKLDVERIWQNQAAAFSCGMQKLTRLTVTRCGNLRFLFSSSIANSFDQLKHLEILYCPLLEETIVIDRSRGEERKNAIIFPQLEFLRMEGLQSLTKFYSGEHHIEFPSLKQLKINDCPQLKEFVVKNRSTDLTENPISFFNEKVVLPNLEILELYEINVERMWQNQVASLSCGIQNLTHLTVRKCGNLRCLYLSSIASSFDRLKHLEISECPLLEEIIVIDGLTEEERKNAIKFPQLEYLMIEDLQNLTKFYSGEDHIEFPSLETLVMMRCPELKEFVVKNISTDLTEIPLFNEKVAFPSLEEIVISNLNNLKMIVQPQFAHQVLFRKLKSMKVKRCDKLKSLTLCGVDSQLERLNIHECGVEEIVFVGDEGEDQTNPTFVFPRVISLKLHDLPNFTTFRPAEPPLFKVFPNLERLSLNGKSIATMIEHFSEDFLCNLKFVDVDLDGTTIISSLDFLQRFLSTKILVIHGGDPIDERFASRNKKGMSKAVISNLNKYSDLKDILKEESNMDNVVDLKVKDCDNLINLVPCSTSFQNLTTLMVLNCKGLQNIVTFSTAKSLMRLRNMRIHGCNTITEIVADENEGDATKDGIIFRELEELSLIGLKSLTSFCSGNYTYQFPSLKELIVIDCPTIMIFCGGELSTPNLRRVRQISGYEVCWKGDLNTTIQRLHEKKRMKETVTRKIEDEEGDAEGICNVETDDDTWWSSDDEESEEEEYAESSGNEEDQRSKDDSGQPST